jgi:membrane protein DedA with SNARE-associated domain
VKHFLFGNGTALELIGWHIAAFTAFVAGYSLSYFIGHHFKEPK